MAQFEEALLDRVASGDCGERIGEPLASRFSFLPLFPESGLTFGCMLQEITGKVSLGFVACLHLRTILVAFSPLKMILLAFFGLLGQSWLLGRR